MARKTAEPTAAALENELEAVSERLQNFSEGLEHLRAEVEAKRQARGQAAAAGKSTDVLTAEIRDLEDQAAEASEAIPVLERQAEDLRAAVQAAKEREAEGAFDKAEGQLAKAAADVESALREFESETLGPLLVELKKRYDAAAAAEKARSAATGIPLIGQKRAAHRVTFGDRPGFEGLLAALRLHAEGQLHGVEAYDHRRKGVREWAPSKATEVTHG